MIKFLISALVKSISDLLHKVVIEIEIMENRKAHTKGFACLEEMADVGAGILAAGRAVAFLGDGARVFCVLFVQKIDLSLPSEEIAVSCITAGHYAVEEIYAAIYRLNDVLGSSDAHKIAGLILGHIGLNGFDDVIHNVGAFAYGEAAYGIAIALDLADGLHILDTEILICSALVDSEEKLVLIYSSLLCIESVHFRAATLEPADGALVRCLYIVIWRGVLDALVKGHCNG